MHFSTPYSFRGVYGYKVATALLSCLSLNWNSMLEVFQLSQELSDYSHIFSEHAYLLSTAANLFIYIDVPSEVRSEVPDLCADVLFHNSNQRDPELFQLGLQRGQRRGLLQ